MRPIRQAAHVAIRGYQLSLSGLMGRQCRHLPSCSEYTDEAILLHGLWAGGWMGVANLPLRTLRDVRHRPGSRNVAQGRRVV